VGPRLFWRREEGFDRDFGVVWEGPLAESHGFGSKWGLTPCISRLALRSLRAPLVSNSASGNQRQAFCKIWAMYCRQAAFHGEVGSTVNRRGGWGANSFMLPSLRLRPVGRHLLRLVHGCLPAFQDSSRCVMQTDGDLQCSLLATAKDAHSAAVTAVALSRKNAGEILLSVSSDKMLKVTLLLYHTKRIVLSSTFTAACSSHQVSVQWVYRYRGHLLVPCPVCSPYIEHTL